MSEHQECEEKKIAYRGIGFFPDFFSLDDVL